MSAATGLLGLADDNCPARPLLPLRTEQLVELKHVISSLELT